MTDFLQTPKTGDGRIPFHPIVMQFAARLIGQTYEAFMTDYRVLVDANLKCIEISDMDAVSVISDPFRETSGFGATVTFDGNASPKANHIVVTHQDVIALKVPEVSASARMSDRINGVALLREKLGAPFPIVGWIEGPLAEACDLMGISEVLMQMILEPDMIAELMEKCLELGKAFAKEQIRAGATIVGVGDAICSQISPDLYEQFVLPLHCRLFEYIHSLGAKVKLHICGNITHLLPLLARTKPDILDLDWSVSFTDARKTMGDGVWLSGNADPVALIQDGSPEEIERQFRTSLETCGREHFIYSAGCEITPGTAIEKVRLMRALSRTKA